MLPDPPISVAPSMLNDNIPSLATPGISTWKIVGSKCYTGDPGEKLTCWPGPELFRWRPSTGEPTHPKAYVTALDSLGPCQAREYKVFSGLVFPYPV